jgi:F-type H+-transporting ATPase subunit epsilon
MFKFTFVTPEKKIVTDIEVDEVIVPAYRGELDILPGHAPLVTTLNIGVLRYRPKGSNVFESAVVSWGYCEVDPEGVNVLAETAETLDEINRERAEAALKKAQSRLVEPDLEPDQIKKFQRKLERARARIEVLEDKGH